jgi:hypothetical protein
MANKLAKFAEELAVAVLFFFIGLLIILTLLKLFNAQYSISISAFSKAAVGAIVLGKLVPLLDSLISKRKPGLQSLPAALSIAIKTVFYGVVVTAFWILDHIVHASRRLHSLERGFAQVVAEANRDRFLSIVLLTCLMVAGFLAMRAISDRMGKGALFSLFFKRPATARRS